MHTDVFFDAKILVIDDEPNKVRLLSELLYLGGFDKVQSQTDSSQAAASFHKIRPDLVILDLNMVPFDGIQVLAQIRPAVSNGEYMPVLVLTGDITREAKERALAAGAMDFLAKPFNATEILLRVRNLLQTRFLYLALQDERDLLEERVRHRTVELEEARNEVLQRLAFVSEFRDDATGQHTERVSKLALRISLKLGLADKEAELIGKAALLHDIGKVGIPDSILLKEGLLTDEEFSTIKGHAKMGGDILRGSKSVLLQKAEEIARYHHERWNGSGYCGMSGEEIPLPARITAVADVYDALVNVRPYKEAWKVETAVAEIVRLSGSHFDPKVVDAFLRVMNVPTEKAKVLVDKRTR